jgi:hypothetical protein
VHPGESNASWIVRGIIRFLCSDKALAKALRDHFVFLVVPMLNPDGVINGHYRVAMSGHDLNRVYINPNKEKHCTVGIPPRCFGTSALAGPRQQLELHRTKATGYSVAGILSERALCKILREQAGPHVC